MPEEELRLGEDTGVFSPFFIFAFSAYFLGQLLNGYLN